MRLIVGSKDVSELVEAITWSGDTRQIARTLSFAIVNSSTDFRLPRVEASEGDIVELSDEKGKTIFSGILFDIEKSGTSNKISCHAFDLMYYVNQSELSKVFDTTPEAVTAEVCSELGIPFGGAVTTGVNVYMPCFGKSGYEIIMMAYTAASRQNGKKYIPTMKSSNKLYVVEKGENCGVVLEGGYNLTDASYKTSLQKLVNKVLVTNQTGNVTSTLEDVESRRKYGTIQKVYKQEDGEPDSAARSLMEGIERAGSVTGLSDVRAVSGYSIAVTEATTGLKGLFFIESDTHTFENGKATMQLTLAFQNMMDEKEIEKEGR